MQRGTDSKAPRKLPRFHYVVTLAESYWYIDYEKYAKEFVAQITDWIESNPPELGISW